MKDKFLEIAKERDDVADVFNEQARCYEEAGVRGIHPDAPTLRAWARRYQHEAAQFRKRASQA